MVRKAILSRAILYKANLSEAKLNGADLSGAIELTQEQISKVTTDEETKLPSYLQSPNLS